MTKDRVLLIFVKNPEPGKVKTRLAAETGADEALEIYKNLLVITEKASAGSNAERQVWYSNFIEADDHFSENKYSKFVQKGGNLGERMSHAISGAFQSGYKRVVIIGSDCPELTSEIINEAFDLLVEQDAVVGPSEDGGYYLLGLSRYSTGIFRDISWSTPDVLRQTLKCLEKEKFTYKLLPVLNDIDTLEDFNKSRLAHG